MHLQSVFIVFPNQLFQNVALLRKADMVYLVEEFLYFRQYKFHKQKLVFHRASMKYYADYLCQKNITVQYIEAGDALADIRQCIAHLSSNKISAIHYYDVCDDWLEKRMSKSCQKFTLNKIQHPTPMYLNTGEELETYFGAKDKYFQADFYILQRKKTGWLMDEANKPAGGKWSYDADNRQKYPKNKTAPVVKHPAVNIYYAEAFEYVETNFAGNYGKISSAFIYPVTHAESAEWLQQFLQNRLKEFGVYEDAIVGPENILNHSVLTPMLNVGLLTPDQIAAEVITCTSANNVPLNSAEGFIRQLIGWREFIRGVYVYKGAGQRTRNFWRFYKKIPSSFYTGTTRIVPIDITIKKILDTGYCHHIERLMLLGNFMLLCRFSPDEVYKWFMEMFVDAYDWVMVPNVYGMSQFADGGIMATKPYISGSSYVLKMSDYQKGGWCRIWDALFWHFMNEHRAFFLSNPRMSMLIKTFDKMSDDKKREIVNVAKSWLDTMSNK